MKQAKKLCRGERLEIELLLNKKYSYRAIAGVLGRSPNTISYEVETNGGKHGYNAKNADQYACTRKKDARYQWKKIEHNQKLRNYIISGLMSFWNPDEIAGAMRREKTPFYASKTAIYEWLRSVYGQRYCPYLYSRRWYRKKRIKKTKRDLIPHRVSLEKRPREATNRTRYGHWETDAMVSKKGTAGGVQTSQERKSRFIYAMKRTSMSPKETVQILDGLTRRYRAHSFTYDNGIENRNHEKAPAQGYFCDPYSSWQKGGVENANKMIRRFFPKGTDFNRVSERMLTYVVSIINRKPRKILGYLSALEVASAHGIIKQTGVLIRG
jgi:transposase, IS30 family